MDFWKNTKKVELENENLFIILIKRVRGIGGNRARNWQLYRSNLERRGHFVFLVRIGREGITISPIKLYSIYKYIPPYLNFSSES